MLTYSIRLWAPRRRLKRVPCKAHICQLSLPLTLTLAFSRAPALNVTTDETAIETETGTATVEDRDPLITAHEPPAATNPTPTVPAATTVLVNEKTDTQAVVIDEMTEVEIGTGIEMTDDGNGETMMTDHRDGIVICLRIDPVVEGEEDETGMSLVEGGGIGRRVLRRRRKRRNLPRT
jgi:hypothetical protein